MNEYRTLRKVITLLVFFAILGSLSQGSTRAVAAGTVTNCDEASLRAAMVGGGLVTFDCDGTIVLTNQLVVNTNLVLDGNGHSVVLSGRGSNRVLTVGFNRKLTLRGLTIADGYLANDWGAGLYNTGMTEISDCTFSNNYAAHISGVPGFGGAIGHYGGRLTILRTTFVRNRTDAAGSAISVNQPAGGSAASFAITNCTFYENYSKFAPSGCAISALSPLQQSWIVNCTFAWNTNGGISVSSAGQPVTMINTIVANSVGGADCSPSVVGGVFPLRDGGWNIVSDDSAPITNVTSLRNTNPGLGLLADNSGPTWTVELLPDSPAIDRASSTAAPSSDQRGLSRPMGAAADVGAYEWITNYGIRGRIRGATLANEVVVSVGTNLLVTSNGGFFIAGQPPGAYTVTPSHPDYLFAPANQIVSVGPDRLNIDFKAYRWNALSLEDTKNGSMHLAFAGTNDQQYRVLASTNLTDWITVSTNATGTSNLFHIYDPGMRSNRMHFFRTVTP